MTCSEVVMENEEFWMHLLAQKVKIIARLEGPDRRKNWWVEYQGAIRDLRSANQRVAHLEAEVARLQTNEATWQQTLRPTSLPPMVIRHLEFEHGE